MERRAALDVALDMVQRPLLARHVQDQPLPDDVLQLVRIAADSEEDLSWASRTRARTLAEIREAAVMFLQQVLFHPRADNFRVLGLRPNATLEELHEHRRWLLKWLHPDRNHDKWESQLFKRVVDASSQVQRQLSGASPAFPSAQPSRRPARDDRNRRHHRRAQNAPKQQSRTDRLKRHIRRGCYFMLTAAILVLGWQVLTGQSIADLSAGRGTWMDW